MSQPPPDLSHILTPKLYKELVAAHFPWTPPVDMAFASKFHFLGIPNNTEQVSSICHEPALKPLSELRPLIPSLIEYLPAPSSREFPEEALGLILLVDLAPRKLYGTSLWTNGYFDVVARKLSHAFLGLKPEEQPDVLERWTKELGYPFEDAMVRKYWLYSPLIHSEDMGDHLIVREKIEEMRCDVEKYSGVRDPWRETRERDGKDTTLFARLIRQGPPETFAEFFFWLLRVFDAHDPIIEKYGRYPYRNEAVGRKLTSEEELYLKETGNFGRGKLSEEEIRHLRVQVETGNWDPL